MAMKAAATMMEPRGLRRMFSITSFIPPSTPQVNKAPQADPSTNLFVSGLSKRTTTEGLKDAFAKFGEVVQARVVTDRVSGYSKGFGFVKYATLDEAAAGIQGMDGKFLDGWVIFAEYARPRAPPENTGMPPQYGHGMPSSYGRQ